MPSGLEVSKVDIDVLALRGGSPNDDERPRTRAREAELQLSRLTQARKLPEPRIAVAFRPAGGLVTVVEVGSRPCRLRRARMRHHDTQVLDAITNRIAG